jgi:hypothetical protein
LVVLVRSRGGSYCVLTVDYLLRPGRRATPTHEARWGTARKARWGKTHWWATHAWRRETHGRATAPKSRWTSAKARWWSAKARGRAAKPWWHAATHHSRRHSLWGATVRLRGRRHCGRHRLGRWATHPARRSGQPCTSHGIQAIVRVCACVCVCMRWWWWWGGRGGGARVQRVRVEWQCLRGLVMSSITMILSAVAGG